MLVVVALSVDVSITSLLLAVLVEALLAAVLGVVTLAAIVLLLLLLLLLRLILSEVTAAAAAAAECLTGLEALGGRLERSSAGSEAALGGRLVSEIHLLLGLARQVIVLGGGVILHELRFDILSVSSGEFPDVLRPDFR